MTAVTFNTNRTVAKRAWVLALPFAAGGLIGAAVTLGVTSDDTGAAPTRAAATAAAPASIATVTVSAEAAERWALADQREQLNACATTHHAPDAVARCVEGG